MMRRALVFSLFALLLAVPGQALGAVLAPPGKAGADQYFETIPTSGGNAAPPQGTGPAAGSGPIAHLGHGHAGAVRLSHLGKDGAAAASLASATAPANGSSANAGTGAASDRELRQFARSYAVSQPPGQSASSALAGTLTGSDDGGLGFLFPALLVGALIVAIWLGVSRMRRHARPT